MNSKKKSFSSPRKCKELSDSLSSEEKEERRRLAKLIKVLTTTGLDTLELKYFEEMKCLCLKSDDLIHFAYKNLFENLHKDHSQIRLSSLQICDQLLRCSKVFRVQLIGDLPEIFPLVLQDSSSMQLSFTCHELPPPKEKADLLCRTAMLMIKQWYDLYGLKPKFFRLKLGHRYVCTLYQRQTGSSLHDVETFSQPTSSSVHLPVTLPLTNSQTNDVIADEINVFTSQLDDCLAEMTTTISSLDSCLHLLLPAPDEFSLNETETDKPENNKTDVKLVKTDSRKSVRIEMEKQEIVNENHLENQSPSVRLHLSEDRSEKKSARDSCAKDISKSSISRDLLKFSLKEKASKSSSSKDGSSKYSSSKDSSSKSSSFKDISLKSSSSKDSPLKSRPSNDGSSKSSCSIDSSSKSCTSKNDSSKSSSSKKNSSRSNCSKDSSSKSCSSKNHFTKSSSPKDSSSKFSTEDSSSKSSSSKDGSSKSSSSKDRSSKSCSFKDHNSKSSSIKDSSSKSSSSKENSSKSNCSKDSSSKSRNTNYSSSKSKSSSFKDSSSKSSSSKDSSSKSSSSKDSSSKSSSSKDNSSKSSSLKDISLKSSSSPKNGSSKSSSSKHSSSKSSCSKDHSSKCSSSKDGSLKVSCLKDNSSKFCCSKNHSLMSCCSKDNDSKSSGNPKENSSNSSKETASKTKSHPQSTSHSRNRSSTSSSSCKKSSKNNEEVMHEPKNWIESQDVGEKILEASKSLETFENETMEVQTNTELTKSIIEIISERTNQNNEDLHEKQMETDKENESAQNGILELENIGEFVKDIRKDNEFINVKLKESIKSSETTQNDLIEVDTNITLTKSNKNVDESEKTEVPKDVNGIDADKDNDINEDKDNDINEDKDNDINEDKVNYEHVNVIDGDKVNDINEYKNNNINENKVNDINEDKVNSEHVNDIDQDKVNDKHVNNEDDDDDEEEDSTEEEDETEEEAEVNRHTEAGEYLREMGVLFNTNITITLPSDKIEISETEDNCAILENARGSYNLMKKKYLPLLHQWHGRAYKAQHRPNNTAQIKTSLKKYLTLRAQALSLVSKYEKIRVLPRDPEVTSRKRPTVFTTKNNASEEEDSDDSEDMEEVEFEEAELLPILVDSNTGDKQGDSAGKTRVHSAESRDTENPQGMRRVHSAESPQGMRRVHSAEGRDTKKSPRHDDWREKRKREIEEEWSLRVSEMERVDPSSGYHHKRLIAAQRTATASHSSHPVAQTIFATDARSKPGSSKQFSDRSKPGSAHESAASSPRKKATVAEEEETPSSVYAAFSERKRKLLALAPRLPYDTDLYHWEDEALPVPRLLPNSTEGHRFWSASALDEGGEGIPVPGGAALYRTRVIEFSGQATTAQYRPCRAPLPSGKLCPRRDQLKCPFHGIIYARDERGKCLDPEDEARWQRSEEEKRRLQVPDWQAPALLRELKASTGVDLTMPRKGQRRRVAPGPGLIQRVRAEATPAGRLKKKIFQRGALRRVARALNKIDQRKFRDKFGDQFNYS